MRTDEDRAKARAHYALNKETIRAKGRVYYQKNLEKLRTYRRAYAEKNRERIKANYTVWAKANPGKTKVYRDRYIAKDPEGYKAKMIKAERKYKVKLTRKKKFLSSHLYENVRQALRKGRHPIDIAFGLDVKVSDVLRIQTEWLKEQA